MADLADQAQMLVETHLESALSQRMIYQGDSFWFCEDCAQPIPETRRKIIPGVKKCTSCQTAHEIRTKLKLTHKQLRKGYYY